jgi:hypothetical protein
LEQAALFAALSASDEHYDWRAREPAYRLAREPAGSIV